jgi:serine/threonine protein kinase
MRPLGEGGAGIVYAASDERIGAEVAIKVVLGASRRDHAGALPS